ncbi:bifunctional 2-polyprenyl-6-hydroxyphenol methylase/3-demethylubiquinol 3-O-methyltransferase UbiG [Bradyrhizobium sp. URHD0069]|uniref:class I SAM-dependent methyltransferase n=1 Tax=Bradyrhizobium sp. URHD0069 TaxID=1380355 RepID=UPI00049514D9|nr:methyltransferase domain-containing protein [Bradyrhizobium sp. URHD0069]
MTHDPGYKLQRRVAGYHDIRMDGITDLVCRAKGASVFDIGCNRGLVSFEMANNGATVCHGCDKFEEGIRTARELFADLRTVESKFEVVDLTGGGDAVTAAFGDRKYDIVLMLATYHKLKRVMPHTQLCALIRHFGDRTKRYFAWRGTSEKIAENEEEKINLDANLIPMGFRRIHTSYISEELGMAAIWKRA